MNQSTLIDCTTCIVQVSVIDSVVQVSVIDYLTGESE